MLGRLALGPRLARRPCSAAQILSTGPRRLLVVRVHDQIGDMVCATGTLAVIRRQFPACRLSFVCAPRHEPVLRHNPDLDDLLIFDRARFNRSVRTAGRFRQRLRALRVDGAFVLNNLSFSTTSALIAAGSGARWIVGGSGAAFGWSYTRWLYSLELPLDPASTLPATRQGPLALRAAGFDVADPLPGPVFVPGEAEDRQATAFLNALGPGQAIGLHPGAGKPGNRWPAARFAEVVRLLQERGLQPWVLQGPQDAVVTAELFAMLGRACPVLREVDLCVAAAALARSAAVLVNDSGPMHLAAAAGARGVALFGPTPASLWAPPGDRLHALQAEDRRMTSIGVDAVLAALTASIGRGR